MPPPLPGPANAAVLLSMRLLVRMAFGFTRQIPPPAPGSDELFEAVLKRTLLPTKFGEALAIRAAPPHPCSSGMLLSLVASPSSNDRPLIVMLELIAGPLIVSARPWVLALTRTSPLSWMPMMLTGVVRLMFSS